MATYRKLPSGRWQVQIRSKNSVPLSKTFPSKLEADKWARNIESQIDLGTYVDRSELNSTTFGDLIDRYLIEVTPSKKSKDVENRRLKALRQEMGGMKLSAIQNKDIAAYRDRRLNVDGCSGSTVISA